MPAAWSSRRRPCTDFAPLYCEEGGEGVVTQFDKDDVEAAGLVKFDFLGLRTLTIIDWAVKAINARRAAKRRSAARHRPAADGRRGDLRAAVARDTTAVFQLESRGMKD
jgi:DNA polymerase-3 subunit alpha